MKSIKKILKEFDDKGLKFKPQDIAANLFYMMIGEGKYVHDMVYNGLKGRTSVQKMTSVENIRLQTALLPLLKEILTKAMRRQPEIFTELLDNAPKEIGYEDTDVLEERVRAMIDGGEEVNMQELKNMVIKNIYVANARGDYKAANDSTKLLFQYFNIEDTESVRKYIVINEKNNDVCPHCHREVKIKKD